MPLSLQRSGITGRVMHLAGPIRGLYDRNPRKAAEIAAEEEDPIPGVTEEAPELEAPVDLDMQKSYGDYASPTTMREPLDPMGFEEAQPTPLGMQEGFMGNVARDFGNPMTALNYGLGLAASFATANPIPLGMAAARHLGTRALKDYAVPYLKKTFAPEKTEVDPTGNESALGGSGNVDPSKGFGFDMTSSNMPGGFGESDPTGVSNIGKGVGNLGFGPTDRGFGFDMASANEPGGEYGGSDFGGFDGTDNDDGGWW